MYVCVSVCKILQFYSFLLLLLLLFWYLPTIYVSQTNKLSSADTANKCCCRPRELVMRIWVGAYVCGKWLQVFCYEAGGGLGYTLEKKCFGRPFNGHISQKKTTNASLQSLHLTIVDLFCLFVDLATRVNRGHSWEYHHRAKGMVRTRIYCRQCIYSFMLLAMHAEFMAPCMHDGRIFIFSPTPPLPLPALCRWWNSISL